jgi:hypothetical protein
MGSDRWRFPRAHVQLSQREQLRSPYQSLSQEADKHYLQIRMRELLWCQDAVQSLT